MKGRAMPSCRCAVAAFTSMSGGFLNAHSVPEQRSDAKDLNRVCVAEMPSPIHISSLL